MEGAMQNRAYRISSNYLYIYSIFAHLTWLYMGYISIFHDSHCKYNRDNSTGL